MKKIAKKPVVALLLILLILNLSSVFHYVLHSHLPEAGFFNSGVVSDECQLVNFAKNDVVYSSHCSFFSKQFSNSIFYAPEAEYHVFCAAPAFQTAGIVAREFFTRADRLSRAPPHVHAGIC